MKCFDSTRCKYFPSFMAACYLTNYLHERCMDFTYTILECNGKDDGGWDGTCDWEKLVHGVGLK